MSARTDRRGYCPGAVIFSEADVKDVVVINTEVVANYE